LGNNIISQYVVGTGGADCDNDIAINNEFISISKIGGLKYKLEHTIKSFGFLHCEENGDDIEFNFVQVAKCNDFLKLAENQKKNKKLKENNN